jgi:hypothetical protein
VPVAWNSSATQLTLQEWLNHMLLQHCLQGVRMLHHSYPGRLSQKRFIGHVLGQQQTQQLQTVMNTRGAAAAAG